MMLDRTLTLLLNGSSSLYLDGLAWTATQTLTWLPLAVVLFVVIVRNNDLRAVLSLLVALAIAVTLADQVASSVFKPLVARFRPAQNPELMYIVDVVNGYRGGLYGFFSSHAANTFAIATFVALLIRHRTLSIGLFSWALLNCWTRVYLGVHYVGDLTVGALWGALVGWGAYALWHHVYERHLRPSAPELGLDSADIEALLSDDTPSANTETSTGYKRRHAQWFVVCILLTYLYICVRAFFFS